MRLPTLDEIRAEKARRHLRDFVRYAWPVLEPETPLVWSWHVEAICDHLEAVSSGDIRRLLINVPPGHAKSLLVSVFWPAWMWVRRPGWRALFSSYKAELAVRDSVRCRSVITSPWYQTAFRPEWKLSGDQNVKSYFQNSATGVRQSIGVGGGATGFRGDAVVVDDPLKADEWPSPDELEKVISWWDFQMSSRLNDMSKGARVVIMQRLHERDLSGYLLERGGYEHLCLPSEYDPGRSCVTSIGFKDPRTERGELLFPARFDASVIAEAKRDLGPYGYSGQHDQSPSPAGGSIIREEWIRYWYPHDVTAPTPVRVTTATGVVEIPQAPLPRAFDARLQSWDLAFKGGASSDFVAGHVWHRAGANCYLVDRCHARLDFVATLGAIRDMSARHPVALEKLVEDKANGPAVLATLRDEIPGLVPVTPDGGKEARLHSVAPLFAAGNVWLPHPSVHPWSSEVVAELVRFPKAPHDDDVDAATQALSRLHRYDHAVFFNVDAGSTASTWRF
jgi:predicted phage terminase large subunit-like protein